MSVRVELADDWKFFDHQIKTLEWYLEHPKTANWSEMGAGKTLPTAALVKLLLDSGLVTRYIIVVPRILLYDWVRVFKEQLKDFNHSIHVYHGPNRLCREAVESEVLITTYQIVVRDFEFFKTLLSGKHVFGLVVDEAQNIREPKTKQSKAVRALAKAAEYVQFLSGNPAPNGLHNYWAYLSIIDPDRFSSYFKFLKEFTVRQYGAVVGFKNASRLASYWKRYSIRFLKRECLDLPDTIFDVAHVIMNPEHLKLYTKATEDIFLELPTGRVLDLSSALAALTRMRQIASNPSLLGFDIKSNKFELFEQDLKSYPEDKKIVVFTEFIGSAYKLKEIAESLGRRCAQLFDTTKVNVEKEKQKFIEDHEVTVVIANPKSAGVGVNFSVSSFNIFFEYSHDLNLYSQAIERSSRPGLKEPLTVRHYAVVGTIEPRILLALQEKKNLLTEVLRDKEEFIRFLKYDPDMEAENESNVVWA